MSRISQFRWQLYGAAVVIAIWVLSLIPHPVSIGVQNEDKAQHFIAYGTLMWWWCGAVQGLGKRALIAVAAISMGIAVEFVQGWTGWRTFDVDDMIANGVGVLIGWAIAQTPVSAALLRKIKE